MSEPAKTREVTSTFSRVLAFRDFRVLGFRSLGFRFFEGLGFRVLGLCKVILGYWKIRWKLLFRV